MSWGEVGLGPSNLLTPPVLEGRKDQSCDEGDFEACLPTLPWPLHGATSLFKPPPHSSLYLLLDSKGVSENVDIVLERCTGVPLG